jgi:hypothetical protein
MQHDLFFSRCFVDATAAAAAAFGTARQCEPPELLAQDVLKNAINWASRSYEKRPKGKPSASVRASDDFGAARGSVALHPILKDVASLRTCVSGKGAICSIATQAEASMLLRHTFIMCVFFKHDKRY